eukprot:TRINITY_DN32892_c0_g1_i1.p1 TRINITY_DN32892_c0_g1~~TRINITY_DN32892_c0_g1_i1.p1  ORF type:complete len:292 (+),score=67.59 TRINITY_DN32892_c0_g1_i1:62-877(+)
MHPSGDGLDVVAVRQRGDFDCGLACAAMVVLTVARRYRVGGGVTAEDVFEDYAARTNHNTSIWTIDVFDFLDAWLDRLGAADRVEMAYLTTTLGCNSEYKHDPFYSTDYSDDEQRVTRLFADALGRDKVVRREALPLRDLLAFLSDPSSLAVVLVDAAVLARRARAPSALATTAQAVVGAFARLFAGCGCAQLLAPDLAPHPPAAFQGHYVVATAFDSMGGRVVTLYNPATRAPQVVPVDVFDAARTAFGTDYDVITVRLRDARELCRPAG